ncbi:hypothetical protein SA2016_0940 [Sinomonas atrocyanea]|uniref:Uncharacterized protein n=1 Tax=Sinomonas atrocyanea TaxID=37927 RepID=A0A126ZXL5_9MICC|nr:hypothetical protein SA2016_0940 [Sinomonas atrocyanea]GEB64225.1 hypothetical protein SAT01_16730 [Sinomonas atrocyanea]GGG57383.1 hypothetical protein GCM10007172_05330 [Sinomonas atrocyanea]
MDDKSRAAFLGLLRRYAVSISDEYSAWDTITTFFPFGRVTTTSSRSFQSVEGIIIGREDDPRIRRALSVAQNIRFMKYRVEFHLE